MKYSELIHFEPIETVTQLKSADDKEKAKSLIKTYVMSDKMADMISTIVIQNLRFDIPQDNKGVFIVGNYGTGKSHLMSVISSIAEHEDLLALVDNQRFVNDAAAIAGRFKVLRIEIGGVETPLRDIILNKIEEHLKSLGIEYKFPSASTIANNKESLMEMMSLFQDKYPDCGYLIVVDELLDYLRGQKEHEMMKSLGFLRELGEVASLSRIRVIAGIQEALYDVPSFQRMAQAIKRVMDRFEQLFITREDISYVISNRLLKKDDKQKEWIRRHLEKFSHLYEDMSSRMDRYVELFPIHPMYIDVFEKILVVEKREILKTVSRDIKKIIDKEIGDEEPDLISFDAYWSHLKEEKELRTIPGVRDVIDKGGRLEDIIDHSFPKKSTKPLALRIIHAICVYRLTTDDYTSPIGLTAKQMRDDLCLYTPVPELTDDFLLTTVETSLKDIIKTVSGQFIGHNQDNGQYYLDIKKDIDYDAEIEKEADILEEDDLTDSYYDAILKVMNWDKSEYVRGMKIWEYDLLWDEKKVMREGYLFLGTPADRPTAQPPHDFYIYFISPYEGGGYFKEDKEDEVFFVLKRMDEEFEWHIKLYAASISRASRSSADDKKIYNAKAEQHMKDMVNWLTKNVSSAFEVIYRGVNYDLSEVIKGSYGLKEFKDYIDRAASNLLSTWFRSVAPEYPSFKTIITKENREKAFKDALDYLNGRHSDNGRRVLEALELLDGDEVRPGKSRYARSILEKLNTLEPGRVLNRKDILTEINGYYYDAAYRLEAEWVFVAMAALVYSGDIVVSISGKDYDAAGMDELAKMNPFNLVNFAYIKRPEGPPIAAIRKLMEFLGLPPGQANYWNTSDTVNSVLSSADALTNRVIEAQKILSAGISAWGIPFIDDKDMIDYKEDMKKLSNFLDGLKKFNTPAKLKNFRYQEAELDGYKEYVKIIEKIEKLKAFKDEIDSMTSYLMQAEAYIGDKDLEDEVNNLKGELKEAVKNAAKLDSSFIASYKKKLQSAIERYIDWYMDNHKKYRLDVNDDNRKKKIMNGEIKSKLDALKNIKVVSRSKYLELLDKLSKLQTCYSLTKQDMEKSPVCHHCGFNPQQENILVYGELDKIEEEMSGLLYQWKDVILDNIEDPALKDDLQLLNPEQRKIIEDFKRSRELPDRIDYQFVSTIETLLEGLDGVKISTDDLISTLKGNGTPYTMDEMYRRFDEYIKSKTRGKNKEKIRIIIE